MKHHFILFNHDKGCAGGFRLLYSIKGVRQVGFVKCWQCITDPSGCFCDSSRRISDYRRGGGGAASIILTQMCEYGVRKQTHFEGS